MCVVHKETNMKGTTMQWAVRIGAGALTLALSLPGVAQSRNNNGDWNRNDDRNRGQVTRNDSNRDSYRDNQRVTMAGSVRSFSKERNGYRVQLDRGRNSFFVPQSYFRNNNGLRVGVNVSLGGIFRGGTIYVDAVNWPGRDGRYDDRYDDRYASSIVSGVVDRVDRRSEMALIRDSRSGRMIEVDLRNTDRNGRIDASDLRRGDYVELSGRWNRDEFLASQIESVRTR
jgi:hypothetical protein